jgi:adenylate cyclase
MLGLVLISVLIAVNEANMKNIRAQIEEDLQVTNRVFTRLIKSRRQQLGEWGYLFSSDFAFKQAIATNDHYTILSAMESLKARIAADTMALVSTEHILIADTMRPDVTNEDFRLPGLIEAAEDQGQAFSIVLIGNQAHQTIVVPILAPIPIAWLCISFNIDEEFARELQMLTLSHISLFHVKDSGHFSIITSTLPPALNQELLNAMPSTERDFDKSLLLELKDNEYLTIFTTLFRKDGFNVIAVLQRSLNEALQPYYRLRAILISLSIGGLLVSLIGGILIARTVTNPVLTLVKGAREIGKGNYGHRVYVDQQDEIGELAGAFNTMTEGLAEKEKIRTLLGKVVAPDVAKELLNKEVKLGGEERIMTAFFSDITGFTPIAEKLAPGELVKLLNEYLSEMTDLITETGGTVDKFIGDAIVAFWGAPLSIDNHAELAVSAAVKLQKKLNLKGPDSCAIDCAELQTRVGINTGNMVVGNIGSKDRMDYTIIGDAVNLAARLEKANKYYGTGIIISEFTHSMVMDKFWCRELDLVRVQGKQEAIRIFEVIDNMDQVTDDNRSFVHFFEQALEAFRGQHYTEAMDLFEKCDALKNNCDKASRLYTKRINELSMTPPLKSWDGVYPLPK